MNFFRMDETGFAEPDKRSVVHEIRRGQGQKVIAVAGRSDMLYSKRASVNSFLTATDLNEAYLQNSSEKTIMDRLIPECIRRLTNSIIGDINLYDIGCGDGNKILRGFLGLFEMPEYSLQIDLRLVDCSRPVLHTAALNARLYGAVLTRLYLRDLTSRQFASITKEDTRNILFVLGGTIGNLYQCHGEERNISNDEQIRALANLYGSMNIGDMMYIGLNLEIKAPDGSIDGQAITACYNDDDTREFMLNAAMNFGFGRDDLTDYKAEYIPASQLGRYGTGRVEAGFDVKRANPELRYGDHEMSAGDRLVPGVSYRFTVPALKLMMDRAGIKKSDYRIHTDVIAGAAVPTYAVIEIYKHGGS